MNQVDQIEQIVDTAVSNIRHFAEINTIVGQPLMTVDGRTILPISQVTFGFVAGGGEYGGKATILKDVNNQFAGGSGGGATLTPVGFLVISPDSIKMVRSEANTMDKLLDIAKDLVGNLKN